MPKVEQVPKQRLGDILKHRGLVSEADLQQLIARRKPGEHLGEMLLKHGLVGKNELVSALEEVTGCPYVDGRTASPSEPAMKLIPYAKARQYCALPLAIENRSLVVLMADPRNLTVIDELRFVVGLPISPRMGFRFELLDAIESCYKAGPSKPATPPSATARLSFLDQYDISDVQFFNIANGERSKAAMEEIAAELRNETTPAVRLVSAILAAAVAKNASDVHIHPQDDSTTVRIRVDGLLRELTAIPNELHLALVSRIKILASLDIAERRVPQDGRFLVRFGKRRIDLRVSTLPTNDGEKVVMRLLDPAAARVDFAALGFGEEHAQLFRSVLSAPQGMVLVTGPTGSGKSTTLYSALNMLVAPERNILTVEDPVEFKVREISQVQINAKAGLTFATCLRAILRQDPNVIMVGEIRDSETAEIALQAAQTGHLVLSSLHTNDAASAVTRLLDLKIPAYLIAPSLSLVIAQRLVRRLCACGRRAGCTICDHTGFKGRLAVYEMLTLNEPIRAAIRAGVQGGEFEAIARRYGMRTLREDAASKVELGLTTMEEVDRIIGAGAPQPIAVESTGSITPTEFRSKTASMPTYAA